jgi:hypothetical protein
VRKNVTITLDEETARWARMEAARRETSVSRLVGEILRERMVADTSYQEAMEGFLGDHPVPLKARRQRYPSRDELHERGRLRRH